jgi:hypothetical protein
VHPAQSVASFYPVILAPFLAGDNNFPHKGWATLLSLPPLPIRIALPLNPPMPFFNPFSPTLHFFASQGRPRLNDHALALMIACPFMQHSERRARILS